MKVHRKGLYESEKSYFVIQSLYFIVPVGVCFQGNTSIRCLYKGGGECSVMLTYRKTHQTVANKILNGVKHWKFPLKIFHFKNIVAPSCRKDSFTMKTTFLKSHLFLSTITEISSSIEYSGA